MIVVYISNRYIRVAEGEGHGGNIKVKDLYVEVDTNGCVLNGVLTDPDGFANIIQGMWEKFHLPKKGVKLVIGSNQFNSKLLEVPNMKQPQMLKFVSREFSDVERMEDPVYGFFTMGEVIKESVEETGAAEATKESGKKKAKKQKKALKLQKVYATVAARKFIMEYVNLFEKLGISVNSVETARGSSIQLTEKLECVEGKTCVVQFVDDMMLQNLLFDRGNYVYSSRTRMFSEPGTSDFAIEIARSVSNILQFAQAEKLPEPIGEVLVAGIDPEIMELYQDSISRINPDLTTEWLQPGSAVSFSGKYDPQASLSVFALPIGALSDAENKTNILVQARQNPEEIARRAEKKKKFLPIGILAGVMAAGLVLSGGRLAYLKMKLKQVESYTKSQENIDKCNEYDSINEEISVMGGLNNTLSNLGSSICQYPLVNSSVNEVLQSCASGLVDVAVTGYSSEDGTLSFRTSATNADNINKFILALNQQEIFEAVDYTGYTQDSEGKWNVNVYCTMAAGQEEQ